MFPDGSAIKSRLGVWTGDANSSNNIVTFSWILRRCLINHIFSSIAKLITHTSDWLSKDVARSRVRAHSHKWTCAPWHLQQANGMWSMWSVTTDKVSSLISHVQSRPLVRSAFCPKKIDLISGLTLQPGWFWLGPSKNWPYIRKYLSSVDLTSGLQCILGSSSCRLLLSLTVGQLQYQLA